MFLFCLPCLSKKQSTIDQQHRHQLNAEENESSNDNNVRKMTPMHILALNPHADTGTILTLFHANMLAVFEPYMTDSILDIYVYGMDGKTPLDCLGECNVDAYLSVIAALCVHREQNMKINP